MRKFLRLLWPVRSSELSIFLPLFLIKLFVSFNYSILTTIKDTLVVTSTGSGAEIIPVLKGGVVIVCAFLVVLFYSKLSNYVSRRNMFYVMLAPFLLFFICYGLILYPYQEVLIPHQSADWLLEMVGSQHKHWVAVYRYWMHALFFVVAEMWGGVVIGLLFWGFVNQITSIKNAARFYVLYTIGGHLGSLLSGGLVLICTSVFKHQDYQSIVNVLMFTVVSVVCCIVAFYWYTNRKISTDADNTLDICSADLNKKSDLSLRSSILYIIRSPYLGLIALMVISYGLSVNLVEVTWKSLVKTQYPLPQDYQAYMGLMQLILGTVSTILALLVSGGVMRKFGWYISAQLTPIVLGFCSLVFFILFLLFPIEDSKSQILSFSPLLFLVIFGGIHNIACKAMKYCFFDPTKEMAYIPLDPEAKTKGKAAVDLVGSRFGKTGSSWIQILLIDFIGTGSILGVVPLLVPVVLLVVGIWLKAVHGLNKRFNNTTQQEEPTGKLVTDVEA